MNSSKVRVRSGQLYEPVPSIDDDHLEQENTQMAEELKDKVSMLKALSIDIGDEVKYHSRILNEMDDDMDKTGGFLGSTRNRVLRIAKGGHYSYILYLFLFSVFAFFVLYLILKVR